MAFFKKFFKKKEEVHKTKEHDTKQVEAKEESLQEETSIAEEEKQNIILSEPIMELQEAEQEEEYQVEHQEVEHVEESAEFNDLVEETAHELEEQSETVAELQSAVEETAINEETQAEEVMKEEPKKKGLFSKLFSGLTKTRDNFLGAVDDVLRGFKKIDEELYEELEEALIMADFGVDTTLNMMERLRALVKERKITEPSELKNTLQEIITDILTAQENTPLISDVRSSRRPECSGSAT